MLHAASGQPEVPRVSGSGVAEPPEDGPARHARTAALEELFRYVKKRREEHQCFSPT